MQFYTFPASPNAIKVLALIRHLELDVEIVEVDLAAGEQRRTEFLEINPNGRIPVLVDGDFTLWESNAILQYLADRSGSELLPRDPQKRADVSRWQFWQTAHWGPACGAILWERLFKSRLLGLGAPDEDEVRRGEKQLVPLAAILNRHLEKRDYLAGSALTLADFSVASFLVYKDQVNYPLDGLVHLLSWYQRVLGEASFRGAIPG